MLDELFYGKRESSSTPYAVINYEYIHRELSKKGVTITLLWNEYCERAYANGEKPYMSTQFGDKYRRWARVSIFPSVLLIYILSVIGNSV